MNLKNYLLEYVSSGRRKRIDTSVEPDTVLKPGDIVRIKDEKWFDSLKKSNGNGQASVDKDGVVMWFSQAMTEFLGEKVVIVRVPDKDDRHDGNYHNGNFYPIYKVELADGSNSDIGKFLFTNDMLEYVS